MYEILGLIDTLETVLDHGTHVPIINKLFIDEYEVQDLVCKIKNAIKKDFDERENNILERTQISNKTEETVRNVNAGSLVYADQVLANMQLIITKMQTNLVKFENSVEEGCRNFDEIAKNIKRVDYSSNDQYLCKRYNK